jgi:hypothetical protein
MLLLIPRTPAAGWGACPPASYFSRINYAHSCSRARVYEQEADDNIRHHFYGTRTIFATLFRDSMSS